MNDSDLELAHELADAASVISLSYFRRDFKSWSKGDGSLATEADEAVEDKVRALVHEKRAGDAVLGEERGQTGSGRRRWIVDGIDGTIEFAAGTSDWGTLVALEIDGRIDVAVCDQPAHRRRYWARRGGGAFRSNEPEGDALRLRVSAARELSAARVYIPPTHWQPDEHARQAAQRLAAAAIPAAPVDHPALQLAAGGYDVVVFFLAGPWDLAAPSLIVEEAGGRFTDVAGHSDLTAGSAVFSNGPLHDEVVRLLRG
jgi:histidinol-phosphatase